MTVLGLSNHADIWELEVWEFGGYKGRMVLSGGRNLGGCQMP